MKSVTIAELKDRLDDYVAIARRGEEIVIYSRSRPVALLLPFVAADATEDELRLVTEGKMRLPEKPFDVEAFLKLPIPKVRPGVDVIAMVIEDREDRF